MRKERKINVLKWKKKEQNTIFKLSCRTQILEKYKRKLWPLENGHQNEDAVNINVAEIFVISKEK